MENQTPVYRSNFIATEETVSRMLQKKNIVSTPGVYACELRVNRPKSEDKRLFWEKEELNPVTGAMEKREYFIANANLLSEYNAQEAMDLFIDGQYQEAANKGMSVRVSPDMADSIDKAVGVCNVKLGYYENKDGIQVLRIEKIVPEAPKVAEKFTFDFFKKKDAMKEAAANAAENFDNQAANAVIIKKQQNAAANAAANATANTAAAMAEVGAV